MKKGYVVQKKKNDYRLRHIVEEQIVDDLSKYAPFCGMSKDKLVDACYIISLCLWTKFKHKKHVQRRLQKMFTKLFVALDNDIRQRACNKSNE